jgi:hypothetical protein
MQTLTLTLGAVPCKVELISYRSETHRALVRQLEPMTWTDSLGKVVSHDAGTLLDVAAHKITVNPGPAFLYEVPALSERPKCRQCRQPLNPVSAMMGNTCGACCRANHRAVAR